uniref:Uncharacterized protein n=1 Tax=Siphoviridae sp. ctB3v5 TaxID=2826186 RepID=A0A8S5M8X3_9CAUD|nr:MAG TPA: hypothetical protein [Siphoviridae sp. ctB3v5]
MSALTSGRILGRKIIKNRAILKNIFYIILTFLCFTS